MTKQLEGQAAMRLECAGEGRMARRLDPLSKPMREHRNA